MAAYFVVVLAVTLGVSAIATPLAIWLARRMNWLDQPADRRTHLEATPRLGGIPLAAALLAGFVVTFPFPRTDAQEIWRVVGLCAGTIIVAVVGLVDDVRELRPLPLFLMQVTVAAIAIASGVVIREFQNPFGGLVELPDAVAVLFTLFWIVGMMNTINFLDGLDGLVGGVTVIAGGLLFLHTFRLEQYSVALLPLALIGATLSFLFFNFPPARIFLGSGAYVLGFALALLSIIGGAKVATALLALAIPILDVAWQIVSRVRAGRSPFAADRGHLHHRLYDSGFSMRAIVVWYYALTAAFGALALALPSGVYKLVALGIIAVGAVAVLARVRR